MLWLWIYLGMALLAGAHQFAELAPKGDSWHWRLSAGLVSAGFGLFWLPLWIVVVIVGAKIEIGQWRVQAVRRGKGGEG